MCKATAEEERHGQIHPEECARKNLSSTDKSCQDSRRDSRRNRERKPAEQPAAVTTAELECPDSCAKGQDRIFDALATVLMHMAETTASQSTPLSCSFTAARVPKVSLKGYAGRIRKFFGCTNECFVLCLVYIDRIVKSHPEIQVNDKTMHRLFLIGTMVAAKFHDDEYASNEYFSKVGGIATNELNALEAEFLELINWRLYVKGSDYDWYLNALRGIAV